MKLSAEAPARVGLTASAGMTLLSAFLLCADPAGPAIWLLVCDFLWPYRWFSAAASCGFMRF